MKTVQKICLVLTIIGAVNWGLVGLFDFNLVSTLLSHLKERGKIERVGSDRKGYWKILK